MSTIELGCRIYAGLEIVVRMLKSAEVNVRSVHHSTTLSESPLFRMPVFPSFIDRCEMAYYGLIKGNYLGIFILIEVGPKRGGKRAGKENLGFDICWG